MPSSRDSPQIVFVSGEKSASMSELMKYFAQKNSPFKHLCETEVLKLEPSVQNGKLSCYIMDELEGPAYDHIVKVLKSRIISPGACLLASKLGIKLHNVGGRVLASIAMYKVVACCTEVDHNTRLIIREKVELMGGRYSGDLNQNTTHLICNTVGSKKYIVASQMSISIVTPDWVETAFKMRKRPIFATDLDFVGQFKVPIFAGCTICVSGIPLIDRKLVEKTVIENGGKYSGELKMKEVTHLIATEAATCQQKVVHALKWNIPIVTQKWLHDCLSFGYFCDPNLYKFPLDKVKDAQFDGDVLSGKTPSNSLTVGGNCSQVSLGKEGTISSLLRFCKAHLWGLSDEETSLMEEVLTRNGGTVYKDYQQGVTHIVCRQQPSPEFLSMAAQDDVCFVAPSWFIECHRQQSLVPLEDFIIKTAISDVVSPFVDPMPPPIVRSTSINQLSETSKNPDLRRQNSTLVAELDDEISKAYLQQQSSHDSKPLKETTVYLHPSIARDLKKDLVAKLESLGSNINSNLNQNCSHCIVEDSVLEENDEMVSTASKLKVKLVSSRWVSACEADKLKVDEASFHPKFVCFNKPIDKPRVAATRSRSKNLKSLEPTPIPSEENASFSVNTSQTTALTAVENRLSNGVTPSKLNFDLKGCLAKLKESTPSSLAKKLTATPGSQSKTESNNNLIDNMTGNEDAVPKISSSFLSKFQKPSDHYVECSQSVQIGWEAESNSYGNQGINEVEPLASSLDNELGLKSLKKQRVFQITNLSADLRLVAQQMIQELGATLNSGENFDSCATHLICKNPTKSEKYLASVAKGLWVLSYEYLEDSLKAGRFLNEEDYEWGSEKVGLAAIHTKHHSIARAAKRWRVAVGQKSESKHEGAYSTWRVLLHVTKSKIKGLSAILLAGGAQVIHDQAPFTSFNGATHAFIDLDKVDMSLINCANLTANGVLCVKTEYIADYLIDESVNKSKYLVVDPPENAEPVRKRVRMF